MQISIVMFTHEKGYCKIFNTKDQHRQQICYSEKLTDEGLELERPEFELSVLPLRP